MLILISDQFYPELETELQDFGKVSRDRADYLYADIILIRSTTNVDRIFLKNAKNLKLLIRGGVGLDNVDLDMAQKLGISVCNTPNASSISVAELAITLILSLTNHIVKSDNTMHKNKWLKKQLKRTELYGKTLGIIGYGRIGNEVARRATAFGMDIIGYHYRNIKSKFCDVTTNINTVLAQADYVSIHLPLNNLTKDFFNKSMVDKCKKDAFIINTGRGETINELAISNALHNGELSGYASDVWCNYPPTDSPLMSAPNVLMTPHLGASTKECMSRIGNEIIQIIKNFIEK